MASFALVLVAYTFIGHIYASNGFISTMDDMFDQTMDVTSIQIEDIECVEADCYISCNSTSNCTGKTIDASEADNLFVTCVSDYSCANLVISNGPKIELDLQCIGKHSCQYAVINSSTTPIVNIHVSNDHAAQYLDLNTDLMPAKYVICVIFGCFLNSFQNLNLNRFKN